MTGRASDLPVHARGAIVHARGVTGTTAVAGPPRWRLGLALVLPVALVAGVLIAAAVVRGQRPEPLGLAAVPAPDAGSAECTELLAALPAELDGPQELTLPRRPLTTPAPAGAAAWGEPAVVLRCGLPRPPELTVTSRLLSISGVQFLQLPAPDDTPDDTSDDTSGSTTTWVAVDRPVYVLVTLPAEAGSGPLQQLTEKIAENLPQRDLQLTPAP